MAIYGAWTSFLEKQTFIDFEVIFVDDCSTDDTYCQLEKYQQQSILSIRIIRNIKNSGPGSHVIMVLNG